MTGASASPPPGLPTLCFALNGRESAQRLRGGKKALVWAVSKDAVEYEVQKGNFLFLVAHEAFSLADHADDGELRDRWLTIRKVSIDGSGSEDLTGKISFYGHDESAIAEHRLSLHRIVGGSRIRVPNTAHSFKVRVRIAGRGQLSRIAIEATLEGEAVEAETQASNEDERALDPVLPGLIETARWSSFEVTLRGYVHAQAGMQPATSKTVVQLWLDGVLQTQAAALPARPGSPRLSFALRCVATRPALETRLEVRIPARGLLLPVPEFVEPAASAEASAPERSGDTVSPGDHIIGSLGEIARINARGWAVNADRVSVDPSLVLAVNGKPFSANQKRARRPDIGLRFGAHDFHGFRFELPPNLGVTEGFEVSVAATGGVPRIEANPKFMPGRLAEVRSSRLPRPEYAWSAPEHPAAARTSFVVVNRNGAGLLRALLRSAVAFEASAEWIVVDHASEDESEAVCDEAAGSGLDLRFLRREANFTFSESNNFGAKAAGGDILIFINNDIVLTEPLSDAMAAALADETVGVAGLTLLDTVPPDWTGEPPVQHVGVFFDSHFEKDQFRPFEARPVPELAGDSLSRRVPAVTGALFAVRRAEFEAIGGFDEAYFYGWEDIELCLRLGLRHDRTTVWLGQRSAFHHHGLTRGGTTTPDPRRATNGPTFNARWGSLLRRRIRADLLARPGFWHGHRPVAAFVVRRTETGPENALLRSAEALAESWQRELPIHVVFPHEDRWADLGEIDILVSFEPGFDPRRCTAARPHLLTIACPLDCASIAPIEAFDHVWVGSREDATMASARLGRSVPQYSPQMIPPPQPPVRVAIKSAAPSGEGGRHWGDRHFAESLAHALRRQGYVVRVDASGHWDDPITVTDDIVIALRGREPFVPRPHQKSILWLISHPRDVAASEMEAYDHVFVASAPYARTLSTLLAVPVEVLHQCTDTRRFNLDVDVRHAPRADAVFVGNSRGEFRDCVRWMVEAGRPVTVYGRGWDSFVPAGLVQASFVPNELIGQFYAASDVVLCDHWPDMRRLGFVANRVFDVLACGGRLIVDDVAGLSELFGEGLCVYRDRGEFLSLVAGARSYPVEVARSIAARIATEHSFEARAAVIAERIGALLA